MGGKIEWVEIIEPRSREKMFVNLLTGECGWDEPSGVPIKRLREHEGHQWWELFDVQTSRFYYYNSMTQQTCWQKPKSSSAVIIPLAKFQLLKVSNGHTTTSSSPSSQSSNHHNPRRKEAKDVACQTKTTCTVLVNNSTQTTPPPSLRRHMIYYNDHNGESSWSTKRSLRSYLLNEARSARGLTGLPPEEVEGAPSDFDDVDDLWESEEDEDGEGSSTSEWDADDEHDGEHEGDEDDLFDDEEEEERELQEKPATPGDDLESQEGVQEAATGESEDFDDYETGEEEPIPTPSSTRDSIDNQSGSFGETYVDTSFVFVSTENATTWTKDRSQQQDAQPQTKSTRTTKNGSESIPPPIPPKTTDSPPIVAEKVKKPPRAAPPPAYAPSPPPLPWTKTSKDDRRQQQKEEKEEIPPPIPPVPPERNYSLNNNSISRTESTGTGKSSASIRSSLPRPPDPPPTTSKRLSNIFNKTEIPPPPPPERKSTPSSQEKEDGKKGRKSLSSQEGKKTPKKTVNPDTPGVMEKFARENVVRHIKRGVGNQLLKRKTSLKAMLSWSKNSIKQPMIATLSTGSSKSEIKGEAITCFKLIQQFMGDRPSVGGKNMDPASLTGNRESIAFDLITRACGRHELRDEFYVQLCRQTTDNPKKTSLLSGFELMAACLMYFPPSVKFSPYLASFLANSPLKEGEITCREDEDTVSLVEHCYKLLIKVRGIHLSDATASASSGIIYCRKPVTPKELDMVLEAIERRFVGIFGESLDSIMKLQQRRWPKRRLPWILTTLCEAILKMGGARIEGIFRIAADADELSFIKLVIDCINFDLLDDDGDILDLLNHNTDEPVDVHVFACLLKLWFRSLKDPIVPYDLYDDCLEAASSRRQATSIVMERLPRDNRLVLGYLIRFLQVFSAKENANLTKMDDSNLSMIWAPNILRSSDSMLNPPSLHPTVIFENTRKEMTFIRTLIQSLDTSFIQGVY